MSPQLTLSACFSALALALLCVMASVRDLGGGLPEAPAPLAVQAGLTPGAAAG